MKRDELVRELEKGKATFSEVSFRGEDLSGITIKGVTFHDCDFTWCNLSNTDITYTAFWGGTLRHAVMREAKVRNVVFDHVVLSNSWIFESTLTDVEFRYCNFNSTKFRATQLGNLDLYLCTFLNSTIDECELSILGLTRTTFEYITGLDVYSVGPVGTFNGSVVYFPSLNKVFAGCWQGNEEEFFAKCTEVTIKHDAELNLDLATDMVKRFMKKGER